MSKVRFAHIYEQDGTTMVVLFDSDKMNSRMHWMDSNGDEIDREPVGYVPLGGWMNEEEGSEYIEELLQEHGYEDFVEQYVVEPGWVQESN